MAGELVLLTGGTGFIGYATLVEALRAGYRVRAAVRRESAKAELEATKSLKPYLSSLSFIVVEDITKDGAFDKAVEGVDYVLHLASPLAMPSDDPEAIIIRPAVRGTTSVLYSALKQASIKKVVITASVASVTPSSAYGGGWDGVVSAESRQPDPAGPYPHYFAAYAASKVLAYNRTLDFIERERPAFSVINIMPSFVLGKNELATTPATVDSGSNHLALINVLGGNDQSGRTGNTVSISDVAEIHVRSLDPSIKGNQNFLCSSGGPNGSVWDDALDVVKGHFPDEIKSGLLPCTGSVKAIRRKVDVSQTERTFGIKFQSFEEQVKELVGWYAQVASKA